MCAMGRLDGKAAIITGGEGSIGMATARAFAAEGARVFLAGISEPDLKAGVAALGEEVATEDTVAWVVTDVRDSAQVKAAVDAAVRPLWPAGHRGGQRRGHRHQQAHHRIPRR